MLEHLHFVRPGWLIGIPLVLVLAVRWARRARASSHWESRIDPLLLDTLLETGTRRRGGRLPWVVAAALTAAAIGLAGPSWERLPQPVEQRSDAMVILLDLSLSMFAEDIAPSRLIRARQKVTDLLRLREEGFTALIAYAGNAHAVVPLTDDVRTIENLLPALSPDMMPVFGSNTAEAIDLAHELFRNAGMTQGRILLVTDGIDRMADATERRQRNFPLSILGVGTDAGGTIPLTFANQPGQVLRSQQGEAILARLDESRLREIAAITYGRYRPLGIGDDDILYLLETPLPGAEETREVDRDFDLWADQGYWIRILLIPLLLLGFRRGLFAVLPLLLSPVALMPMLLLPMAAEAGVWEDLWQRRDQQAHQQLLEGQPEQAATLFNDPDWRAVALYRSSEYASAADLFAAGSAPANRYNLGNALARQGDYRGAMAQYDLVLAEHPDHADARFNRELMEKLLAEQDAADQGNDERQSPSEGDPDASTEPQDGPPSAPEEDPSGDPADDSQESSGESPEQGDPQEGEPEQFPEREVSRDDSEDALEQWLRQIPDDPGGLLRRKFQYETNQRLRRGEFRARDAEKIW